jgi:hypothetical protein
VITESQGTQPYYAIVTSDGSTADVEFARRWLDASVRLMATKYHVVPDRYRLLVNLRYRPDGDVNTSQSGLNRCCETGGDGLKTSTIFLLGPSAPVWKERAFVSSLGLPKSGEDYHAKVLMSESIPIGHQAVQDRRQAGGWSYYSAPPWFIQGLQEYDAIYHTTETNRTQTAAALRKWARANAAQFACCANGLELADVYNGGAAFLAYLAAEFDESVHERILQNSAPTFDEALARETKPRSPSELLSGFRRWLTEDQ